MHRQIITLTEVADLDPVVAHRLVGGKAANLARLAGFGYPVPSGFVVTGASVRDLDRMSDQLIRAATELLADGSQPPFAVRSSAVAEDLADASFAGLYETVLDVPREELPKAVRQVFESASSPRVVAYQRSRAAAPDSGSPGMAVLVQVMVHPTAAGVAFTANPLTGDRREVVVTAVRGLGERLVSGEAAGERWVVRDRELLPASRAKHGEPAISADQVRAVATLARRVEADLDGDPQDIEWAIAGDRLYLLQARPMTAVPDPVSWSPPHEGWWIRNFRLGEWLPEPVTPLFADWLLPQIEAGIAKGMRAEWGLPMRPDSGVVNGWYYSTPPPLVDGSLPLQLLRHPLVLATLPSRVLLMFHPERRPRQLAAMTRHWREELLPRYWRVVEAGEGRVGSAGPSELIEIVDRVAEVAGEYSWSVATLAGSQWKIEVTLARFCRKHIPGFGESPLLLLSGLPGAEPDLPAHAVHSIDWYWPTTGDLDARPAGLEVSGQARAPLAARREAAEAACRQAIADHPALRRRFDRLLSVAQTYAVVREQQTRNFSLGWPLLRRCALQIGEALCGQERLAQAEDVFFLTRSEVDILLAGQPADPAMGAIAQRRTLWEQQRRLPAPLMLGKALAAGRRFYANAIEATRNGHVPPDGSLVGDPASPGRATGRVRVILDPADFPSFRPGEVLVARATAPAWTPLFADAAAVVTDGGSLAAHASLVAREFGIPAVVATGDATLRLRTGQTVTVDGSIGTVQLGRSN